MDDQQHAADFAHFYTELNRRLPASDDDRICHCGQEKQPGEDHRQCWPGM